MKIERTNPFFLMIANIAIIAIMAIMASFIFWGCQSKPIASQNQTVAQDALWVKSLGVGTIQNNLIGKAKDDALLDAKVNAVNKAMGQIISSMTMVQDGQFVKSQIRAQSIGFIEKYEKISAGKISNTEYRVIIRAKVSRSLLKDSVRNIIQDMGRPRMMVLVKETVPWQSKDQPDQTMAGTVIESNLVNNEIPVVDQSTMSRIARKEKKKISLALTGDKKAIVSLGAMANAELIAVGSSEVNQGQKIMGTDMYSMQVNIRLRVINFNTGEIIAAEHSHGAYPHINPRSGAASAMKRVVGPMIKKIIPRIVLRRAASISVLVIGLDYGGVMRLRSQILAKVRGVKSVIRRGSAGKAAKLEILFYGRSFQLTDRLIGASIVSSDKVGEVKDSAVFLNF